MSMFNGIHYEEQLNNFEANLPEGFDPESIETVDIISEQTIAYASTAANVETLFFSGTSSDPLVVTQRPIIRDGQATAIKSAVGIYAAAVKLDLGPNIADANIADLARILNVMSQARLDITFGTNRRKASLDVGRILTARAGQSAGTNNATTVMLTRGGIEKGPEYVPFARLINIPRAEVMQAKMIHDGSKWSGTPTVDADFKVTLGLHCFVAYSL